MAIVIRKKVDLEFLGEDYKDAYLMFKAIPVVDFEQVVKELDGIDGIESFPKVLTVLEKYFLNGEFPDEKGELQPVTKDDLGQLDPTSLTKCFQAFTGVADDPKESAPLTSTSTTAEAPTTTS